MQLKANLHLHSSEDPLDGHGISYSFVEAIDRAATLGFKVLAITHHERCNYTAELGAYGKTKGILLIPGIEQTIEGRHVLMLNVEKSAEQVKTFNDLRQYRRWHPECFVVAPHPYFYGNFSLHKQLDRHSDLFDAIELSWFYSRRCNRNLQGAAAAQRYHKPFIATSDTHLINFLNQGFTTVEASDQTIPAFFAALRTGAHTNTTAPARFWRDMVLTMAYLILRFDAMRVVLRLIGRIPGNKQVHVPAPEASA